jgi:tetratricopeptide (TPR) repeat protein
MRADILSKTKIPSKIHDVESISIHTDILKLIERALDKIQNGNYGYCEICGDKIDKERLEEMPYTMYCIACQEQIELEERSLKVKGGVSVLKKEEEIRKEKEKRAKNFYLDGITYQWKRDYDKAIEYFTKAINLKPDYASFYYRRGEAYYKKGDYDKAIEDFTKAINLEHDNEYFYRWRGYAYREKREYDKAIEDLTKAINLKPNYFYLYYQRGKTYLKKGSYEKAIEDFSKVIEIAINPEYCRYSYRYRGIAYELMGLHDKAQEDFKKAMELEEEKKKNKK